MTVTNWTDGKQEGVVAPGVRIKLGAKYVSDVHRGACMQRVFVTAKGRTVQAVVMLVSGDGYRIPKTSQMVAQQALDDVQRQFPSLFE